MALAALASKAFGKEKVHAFIVDHQLQAVGVSESPETVCEGLRGLGIDSSVLKIEWPVQLPSESRLMMESREKRYRALLDACNEQSISVLLTGHNLEDDLVTMFYRISHQSGLDGIAGMKAATNFPFPSSNAANCFILRPLLEIPKVRLIETCRSLNVPWTHDRSNDNLNFRRNETLEALIDLQQENESISTEALVEMLGFFKKQRKLLFDKGKLRYSVSR
jgi:tRNA(Ile)-lysidine synthase